MKIWRQICAVSMAGVLGLASTMAYAVSAIPAVDVTVGPTAIVTPGPGARAETTLTFEFLADYAFNAITLNVFYDSDFLSFNRSLSTVGLQGGASVPLADAAMLLFSTGEAGENVEFDNPGSYVLTGLTVEPFYPLPQGTKLVLTGVFDLTPSFNATTTTFVTMSGGIAGTSGNPFEEDTFGGLQATVTAVPEPETWMMLLGGLGLIASRMRRASKARSASVP